MRLRITPISNPWTGSLHARVDPADFSGPVDNLRNAIIIILIISIGAGSFIALRFGNSIARRMGDLVELGRKVMVGDFSGAAQEIDKNERMVSGGDEIGEVSEAFTGVVNNIQPSAMRSPPSVMLQSRDD